MVRSDRILEGALVLVLGLGLAVVGGLLLWPVTADDDYRVALGSVVQSADWGQAGARDSLRVELVDGQAVQPQVDGCGNLPGEVLAVEVPNPLPPGDVVVRLAGTGVPAATATAQRISAVLVAVAGIAGALLAWRLRHERR